MNRTCRVFSVVLSEHGREKNGQILLGVSQSHHMGIYGTDWWFQTFGLFSRIVGNNHTDFHIFRDGLKPPTRWDINGYWPLTIGFWCFSASKSYKPQMGVRLKYGYSKPWMSFPIDNQLMQGKAKGFGEAWSMIVQVCVSVVTLRYLKMPTGGTPQV